MKVHPLIGVLFVAVTLTLGAWADGGAPAPMTLTLPDAIHQAIQNNLVSKLALDASEEARGQTLQAASALLPQVTASVQQARVFKVNLESQGFPADNPFFSPLLGPFNSFDARVQLVQTILDFNAIWVHQAARSSRAVAQAQERLAREQVATATALAYLEAQRSRRALTAADADLKLSQSLLKLARDQHRAGVSTGVDVARAETDEAQEWLRLIRAQVASQEASLRLKRVVGIPLNQDIALPDTARPPSATVPVPEQLLPQADADRPEIQVAGESRRLAGYELSSAKSGFAPSVKFMADYGFSGVDPSNTARTGSIGGRLDLPIFSGGKTRGQIVQSRAILSEAESRYRDIRDQVEEDVRLSLQTLAAEIQETQTADKAVSLAQTELKMARDRFGAGVGDNIQVLNAQTSLARALDDQVDAFARYDTARANLAAALGHAETFE